VLQLPAGDKPSIGVCFNPVLYHLENPIPIQSENAEMPRTESKTKLFDLPYKMFFAIITSESVIIYESNNMTPVAVISHVHYASLTDVVWSPDGTFLIVSSLDGYCSFIDIEELLNSPFPLEDVPSNIKAALDLAKSPSCFHP